MTAMLPMISILMLAISTIVLDLCFTPAGAKPADRSHLDDPNAHLEDLVVCIELPQDRSARA